LRQTSAYPNRAHQPLAQALLNPSRMNVSLYQAAAAMNANSRWQEVIGENIASSSIIGFKKQDISFAAIQAGAMPPPGGVAGMPQHFSLPQANATTDFSPGELTHTGDPTDLALEGRGFFEVQMPNGTLAYTRNGSFKLDPQGKLVTKAGYPVMSDGGEVQIDPRSPIPLTVLPSGELRQGANILGRINLTDFNNPQLLSMTGGSYFLANDPNLQTFPAETPMVRQGFLEASNASSLIEMSNLIMAMRMYEANQKVIHLNDERMGRAISELGTPN
jgi:flagellar basal body rod protein FlgG